MKYDSLKLFRQATDFALAFRIFQTPQTKIEILL